MSGYVIAPMPEPVPADDLSLLSQVETATIGHWRHMGFLSRAITPLLRGRRVVGTAVTLAIPATCSTLLHHALSLVRPGDFLFVDRLHDDRHACWGGGVTIAAKAAGLAGAVVDGPCTDREEIEASGFPVWCRGLSPVTTRLDDLGGAMNVPVSCGNTAIVPGHAVLADDSGVLVIPPAEVRAEATAAIARQQRGEAREAELREGLVKLGERSGASKMVNAQLNP